MVTALNFTAAVALTAKMMFALENEGEQSLLELANDGIDFAPKHDADIDDEIYEQLTEIKEALTDGDIETGVDPVTGEMLEEAEE